MKTMPVMRAELLRSIYRGEFTTAGKLLGKFGGGRKLTVQALKDFWYYMYQCTECRRCSLFCPYGIDTAEITIMGRELLNLLGLNIDWIATPVANCYRLGNHLAIQPHGLKDTLEFMAESPQWEAFVETLPEAGVRRELGRMYRSPAAGNLRAKTGTMDRVSALSGIVRTRTGERILFSILSNEVASEYRA